MDVVGVLLTLLLMLEVTCAARSGRRKTGYKKQKAKAAKNTTADFVASLLENYVKQDPPSMSGQPTQVKLGIYVNSFYSISEQTMDYSVNFYLREAWTDPRLAFKPRSGDTDLIKLDMSVMRRIWLPDVFFRNEKASHLHHVTVPNKLLRLNQDGGLWLVTKISATLSCPMDLMKYPMDTQTCPMMFESFGYTMDTMYFSWLDKPVDIDKSVQLPQFQMEKYDLIDCSQNYTAGAFPCLSIEFRLRRQVGFFLIQVYVPSLLIVILSWVSFWINVDAIPARVSLGLLTVLTMTTQSTSANTSLPRVSYIKAIDVWMSMCLIFVFTALLEFAVVNVISRKGIRTVSPIRRLPAQLPIGSKYDAENQLEQSNMLGNGRERRPSLKVHDTEGKLKARRIDKLSRKIFPLVFLLFNVVYWIVYTVPNAL